MEEQNPLKQTYRQIVDVQAQAEKLMRNDTDMERIKQFAGYSEEIKQHLQGQLDDEFILDRVKQIPQVNLKGPKGIGPKLLIGVSSLVGTGAVYGLRQKMRMNEARKDIREIRDRYASIAFLLKGQID